MEPSSTELYPGIYCITQKGKWGVLKPPVNLYFIAGPDGLLFDAGYGGRAEARLVRRELSLICESRAGRGLACAITRVLPSHAHPDHFAGLKNIRRRTGARILLTIAMADVISGRRNYRKSYRHPSYQYFREKQPVWQKLVDFVANPVISFFYERVYGTQFVRDPDEVIRDSELLTVNGEEWRLIPSPGHSADHVALYCENRGILLAGDNVIRKIITWLGPPKSDIADYMATLETYYALPRLDVILSAHGSPVANPRRRIREIIEWRRKRIDDVHRAIARSGGAGIGFNDLIGALYRRNNRIKRFLAEGWVMLTVDYLENEGAIERISKKGAVLFRALRDAPAVKRRPAMEAPPSGDQ